MDNQELKVNKDNSVLEEKKEELEKKDLKARLVSKDWLENQELMELQELKESKVKQDQLDLPDPQDHLELEVKL